MDSILSSHYSKMQSWVHSVSKSLFDFNKLSLHPDVVPIHTITPLISDFDQMDGIEERQPVRKKVKQEVERPLTVHQTFLKKCIGLLDNLSFNLRFLNHSTATYEHEDTNSI